MPATSCLPTRPTPSHPIAVLVVLAMPVKNFLKMVVALQCTVDTMNYYKIVEKHVQAAPIILEIYWIEYFEIVFPNIYNCMYKTPFCKSSHT